MKEFIPLGVGEKACSGWSARGSNSIGYTLNTNISGVTAGYCN